MWFDSHSDQFEWLRQQLEADKRRYDELLIQYIDLNKRFLDALGAPRLRVGEQNPVGEMKLPVKQSWSAVREKLEQREVEKAEERWKQKIEETEREMGLAVERSETDG